jgi:hypothetical protein
MQKETVNVGLELGKLEALLSTIQENGRKVKLSLLPQEELSKIEKAVKAVEDYNNVVNTALAKSKEYVDAENRLATAKSRLVSWEEKL